MSDDYLEHPDSLDEPGELTSDELLPWFVLFASVLGHPIRILVRAAEWRLLFGGARSGDAAFVMGFGELLEREIDDGP
jgi:hypothetical protein